MSQDIAFSERARVRTAARALSGALFTGILIASSALVGGTAASADPAADAPRDLIETPGAFSQPVPAGVCRANITIAGAAGASDASRQEGPAGAGAVVEFSASVSAGQVLAGTIGGGAGGRTGGSNGGGDGGAAAGDLGGGGGGFSDISLGGELLALAGGGGGAGTGHNAAFGGGGDAGIATGAGVFAGSDGHAGFDDPDSYVVGGGQGGQAAAPGSGGVHSAASSVNGFPGVGRAGGDGGLDPDSDSGGGGGGGYFGGGGGASTTSNAVGGAGGGGGSTFVSSLVTFTAGSLTAAQTGTDGYVEFDWVMCDYDLGVTKSAASGTFEENAPLEFTVTVTNRGPDRMAVGDVVTVTDDAAAGATLTDLRTSDAADTPVACDVAVGDEITTGVLECSRPSAPSGPGSSELRGLNVGESLTITYTQTFTGADPVVNRVSVTDRGDSANNAASVTVLPSTPALSLVKAADTKKITRAGQLVHYTFTLTNTGDATLHGFAVLEGEFSGTGDLSDAVCPAEPLAPGESAECTADYRVTAADMKTKSLINVATARAISPAGQQVNAKASTVEIPVKAPAPALAATGAGGTSALSAAALVLILAGGVAFALRRRPVQR